MIKNKKMYLYWLLFKKYKINYTNYPGNFIKLHKSLKLLSTLTLVPISF